MTFSSIFTTDSITIVQGLIVTGVALVLGLISSLVYRFKSYCSKSFAVTLTIIPAIVAMLIMMVNGLATGAGIAVLGVFSLVRFRSQPGSSREILAIMLSMAIGLACGGGYITFAVFAAAVVCIVWLILFSTPFGDNGNKKELRIEIPENLDYEGLFDDIFKEFTTKNEVITVKTVQMGSVYELRYHISLKRDKSEKAFIDGTIEVEEIPALWNAKYREYLGVEVPNDTEGCLQDVHWSGWDYGYFPSYALGSAYGAQILRRMEKDFDVFEEVRKGNLIKVSRWLIDNVFSIASLSTPDEWIRAITGESLNTDYFLDYLEEKFTALYQLS